MTSTIDETQQALFTDPEKISSKFIETDGYQTH
jgi:hypothetical protein